MNRKRTINKIAIGSAALLTAFALKYHYSTATVNDLRWVLAPTAYLVETVTGIGFRFESYSGYLCDDRTFLIAASCSGVNFLIIAFLMLVAVRLLRPEAKLPTLPIAFAGAYATTILANTTRIVIALQTVGVDTGISWFGPDDLHRVEGIVVYFGFLILLFFLSEAFGEQHECGEIVRMLPIPLAIYYICTLGIPIVTGAYERASFRTHSLFVILIPLMIAEPVAFLGHLRLARQPR